MLRQFSAPVRHCFNDATPNVQKDAYLLELSRYIVLNPVRAAMVRTAGDWPWSSYRATTGEANCPQWLQRDRLLSAFAATEKEAVASYRSFVADGIAQPSPWENLKHQVFLGDETLVEATRRKLPNDRDLSEFLRVQHRPLAKPLAAYARQHRLRDDAIAAAYAGGGHAMKAIGAFFGLHCSQVSRIVRRKEKAKHKT